MPAKVTGEVKLNSKTCSKLSKEISYLNMQVFLKEKSKILLYHFFQKRNLHRFLILRNSCNACRGMSVYYESDGKPVFLTLSSQAV